MKNKIATQADYDHAEASALALKARLEQQGADVTVAEKQVAYWQQQLDDTIIRAPFAGVVTSKNAQPGEMISPNLRRRRLHAHRHLHHRGHGLAGDRD